MSWILQVKLIETPGPQRAEDEGGRVSQMDAEEKGEETEGKYVF